MSDNFSIDIVYPLLINDRFSPDYEIQRFFPASGVSSDVAVTRLRGALPRIVEQSSMRQARLRAIQFEIENGDYETPERIRGTVDRLLGVLA